MRNEPACGYPRGTGGVGRLGPGFAGFGSGSSVGIGAGIPHCQLG